MMTTEWESEREDQNNIINAGSAGYYLVRGYKIDGLNNFLFPHARALCIIRLISAELFPLYIHGAQSCVLHLCNWGFHRRRRISLELFQRSNQASKLAPPVLFMGSNQLADRGNFPLI